MQDQEHQAAVDLVVWWAIHSKVKKLPEIALFAIPNGQIRHIGTAVKLKLEGVRAGVSDYMLALPRGGKHGLFLELKKGGVGVVPGKPTKEQIAFGAMVQDQGYAFVIAHGTLEAEDIIEKYLSGI